MSKMDYRRNEIQAKRQIVIGAQGMNVCEGELQSDVAIRTLSPGIEPLSSLDVCVLELYILQIYRRLRCIDATREKVFRTYASIPIHKEFTAEIQRILKSLEHGKLSGNRDLPVISIVKK